MFTVLPITVLPITVHRPVSEKDGTLGVSRSGPSFWLGLGVGLGLGVSPLQFSVHRSPFTVHRPVSEKDGTLGVSRSEPSFSGAAPAAGLLQ
eukprot:5721371-Prymnesium_polylepis.1